MGKLKPATPLEIVQQYIDAFNSGDIDNMMSLFAVPGQILDGMAPHVWQGPTAARDWYQDVLTEGELHGASGYFVVLDAPLHNNVANDNAYIVVPASMAFELNGVKVVQTGAIYTVALQRTSNRWRIAAWAWAKGRN